MSRWIICCFFVLCAASAQSAQSDSLAERAETGDVQAQYEFGSRLIEEKDFRRGIDFLTRAADQEYVSAQYALGILYSEGRGIRVNLDLARKWLSRAAVNGDTRAKQHSLLFKPEDPFPKAMVDALRKDAAKKSSEREALVLQRPAEPFTTLDLKQLRDMPASQTPVVVFSLTVAASFSPGLPAPHLYELARRRFSTNRAEGYRWYWIAHMRARYDAFRCTDTTSHQGIFVLPQLAKEVADAIEVDPVEFIAALPSALKTESQLPISPQPTWICSHGIKAIVAGLQNKPYDNWLVPESEWPAIREKVRADTAETVARLRTPNGASPR